jgi:hypothetical protein
MSGCQYRETESVQQAVAEFMGTQRRAVGYKRASIEWFDELCG